MCNRSSIVIIVLLLLTGCAPKSPAPELLSNGVRFSFFAPSAKSVTIAGGFNQWDPEQYHLMGPDKKGLWTIILPLSTGRHEYRFVINNSEWVLDPASPSIDDGLEGKNSFVIVPP
jgi:1,4-alpha-glucan branching enzyme